MARGDRHGNREAKKKPKKLKPKEIAPRFDSDEGA
jgi:hypothetical protein